MNILILYAKMGQGHESAAKATEDALIKLYSDKINVDTLDFFKLVSRGLSKTAQKAYYGSVKFAPGIYRAFFEFYDSKWGIKFLNKLNYPLLFAAMKKLLKEKNPDIIISTFPIWDYSISQMWKNKHRNAKFINIITDSISIHRAWLIADVDYRIVPNDDTAKVLMKKGVPSKKIKNFGFPVSLEFTKRTNREQTLKFLDLNPKLFTILLFANVGNNRRNVKIFEKIIRGKRDYNVICVTGRNETIMDKIRHLEKEKNVKILGWTTEVPKLMKSSDLIITKAGGATVMECIAAQKPMIITQVIPGQEEGNAELITKHNLGIILQKGKKGIESIPEHISKIRKNYNKYSQALKSQSTPDAALNIAKFINSLLD